LLIRNKLDVAALMHEQSLSHPFHRPAALLDIAELPAEENAVWGSRLDHWRGQCGCTAAIIGLGAFTLASIVSVLVLALQTTAAGEPDYAVILRNGVLFLVGLILSTLAGKLIGLIVATLRFRQTCRLLWQRLTALEA
jgi:hypothetical protein